MFTVQVSDVSKIYSQADNAEVFEVTLKIAKDGEEVEERKLAFPLSTPEDTMNEEIQKFINQYQAEAKMAEENAEKDKIEAQATETMANLKGAEFAAQESDSVEEAKTDETQQENVE